MKASVALALQHRRHGDVARLPTLLGAGQADLGHASPDRHVAADEGGAAGGAALLAVVVGEAQAPIGDRGQDETVAIERRRHAQRALRGRSAAHRLAGIQNQI
jgi:hypothetical protein